MELVAGSREFRERDEVGVSFLTCEVVSEGESVVIEAVISARSSFVLSAGAEGFVRLMVEAGGDLDAVTEVVVEGLVPCQSFAGEFVEVVRGRLVALGFEVREAAFDDAPESGVLYVGTGGDEGLAAAIREIR